MSFEIGGVGFKKLVGDIVVLQFLLYDSFDYLLFNSYVLVWVIVGVDVLIGVVSQIDLFLVVLWIIGLVCLVMCGGKVLMIDIIGCFVNGVVCGDFSSEKVYVKLVCMICVQLGGCYVVSEVKGFISFVGKLGVCGCVVSCEGSFVGQVFFVGIVGGFGWGFFVNVNGIFIGQIGVDGKCQVFLLIDIVIGGIGQGVGEVVDMVSKYFVECVE